MLFLITYKSSLWDDKHPSTRFTRTIMSGLIVYALLYGFTYTKYAKDIELLINNRKYLAGVVVIDLLITVYLHNKAKKQKDKNENFVQQAPSTNYTYPTQYPSYPLQVLQPVIKQPVIKQPVIKQPVIKQPVPKPIYNQTDTKIDISDNKSSQSIPVYNKNNDTIPLYVPNNASS